MVCDCGRCLSYYSIETTPTAPNKALIQTLDDKLIAALVEFGPAPVTVVEPFELLGAEVEAAATGLLVEAVEEPAEVVPPMGAVDCPATSAETEALKVPVMPAIVNKAENDISGNPLLEESVRVLDWIRMKYSWPLGPMEADGTNWMEVVDETLTDVEIDCSIVCWFAFPAQIPTEAFPQDASDGELPLSFHVIVACCPAVKVLVLVGEVMKTVAKAEDTRAEITATLVNILQRFIPKIKLLGWVLGGRLLAFKERM